MTIVLKTIPLQFDIWSSMCSLTDGATDIWEISKQSVTFSNVQLVQNWSHKPNPYLELQILQVAHAEKVLHDAGLLYFFHSAQNNNLEKTTPTRFPQNQSHGTTNTVPRRRRTFFFVPKPLFKLFYFFTFFLSKRFPSRFLFFCVASRVRKREKSGAVPLTG